MCSSDLVEQPSVEQSSLEQPNIESKNNNLTVFPVDVNLYYEFFNREIDQYIFREGLMSLASKISKFFIPKYVRIVDRKRLKFQYLNDNNQIVDCNLDGLGFLIDLVYEAVLYKCYIIKETLSRQPDEEMDNLNRDRLIVFSNMKRNKSEILFAIKTGLQYNSCNTTKTVKSFLST